MDSLVELAGLVSDPKDNVRALAISYLTSFSVQKDMLPFFEQNQGRIINKLMEACFAEGPVPFLFIHRE